MQDFSVEVVHKMFGGSDFSRVERNFNIGQSPKIFSKICIKLNKKWKIIEKIREKNANFSENILIFGRAKKF